MAFGLNQDLADPDEWMRQQDARIAQLAEESQRAQQEFAATQLEATHLGPECRYDEHPAFHRRAGAAVTAFSVSPQELAEHAAQAKGVAAARCLDVEE
ncbi:hypothetical protein [Krasilnikovia sp. M28-CT-15]|uniref:hypothetical protein n=1 Tax=Krasilnikovia sp. M28-CT-15 TaxID=3373540 RepID=UPI003875B108